MIYNSFKDKMISALSFGTMRLPTNEDKSINEELTFEMVDYAIKNGINYFDTAFPYHAGMSEIVLGKALSRYPRESFYLATKYPGHQISDSYDPADTFEKQLKKCGVDYFDFYLLHNIYEKSFDVYTDKKWGIVDYFIEQRRLGRIKHLGFSAHGRPDNLKAFLDLYGDEMEFCQIQLNYLDWTLQNGREKYQMLTERNLPILVMEPVRGGRLAWLDEKNEQMLKQLRPNESIASWSFRWLQRLPNVLTILSGMSNMEQMVDNIKTFSEGESLSEQESELLLKVAEGMKNSLPCTSCRYCCDACPMELDIPVLINTYNDVRFGMEGGMTASMQMEALPEDKLPSACIGCGACEQMCPQNIEIPKAMREFAEALDKLPKWSRICVDRAEEAKRFDYLTKQS